MTRIILARPAVEAGEKLGFLPGDLQEKVNPYLRPLYDALYDMLDAERVERLLERGVIEVAPIAFMRGRTLNDAFVILDEAQNTTSEQMKMFLTRLGFGSKAVVTGDVTQIDLPPGRMSGLVEALQGRRRHRGHRHDPLRRSRRRPPPARAADRQGLRDVRKPDQILTCRSRHVGRSSRLRVVITDAHGRRVASGGVGRWLERAAPPTARGLVSIALVDDRVMRRLNREHRGKDEATDVLSFPSSSGPGTRPQALGRSTRRTQTKLGPRAGGLGPDRSGLGPFLGDLAIATGVARRQAREHGHALNTELRILALHGLLHLLGYDHEKDDGRMARAEERLRRRAGLPPALIARTPRRRR